MRPGRRSSRIHRPTSPGARRVDDLLTAAGAVRRLIADKDYDADRLRRALKTAGTAPISPGRINRKRPVQYDKTRYRHRWRSEAAFYRLKDFRRVATRYHQLARSFLSAVAIAAIVAFPV